MYKGGSMSNKEEQKNGYGYGYKMVTNIDLQTLYLIIIGWLTSADPDWATEEELEKNGYKMVINFVIQIVILT